MRVAILLLAVTTSALAQTGPETASPFELGPHAVGFKSHWALDTTRTFTTSFDDGATYGAEKSPRPILVNCWYPAQIEDEAPAMSHEAYFEIASDDPRLMPLASALAAFARGIAAEEITGKPEPELDESERERLERLLASKTACHRDAQALDGPFPIVVYHSGAGSSFEDNAALCELLASSGFVVVGSAYSTGDGSSLRIDGRIDSGLDMAFLARWAAENASGDWSRIAYVGHSAGAQAILRDACRPASPADVLVLLDTTLDYYALGTPGWRELTDLVLEHVAELERPMLVTAGPEAMFQLIDRLESCERTLLTVPEIGHNEFISQGDQRNRWLLGFEEKSKDRDRAPGARHTYGQLCEYVTAYLTAHLRSEPGPLAARNTELSKARLDTELHVEMVARGTVRPPSYDPSSGLPPTPRQFPHLLTELGVERACEILESTKDSKSLVHESTMLLGSTLFRMIETGEREEAKRLYRTIQTFQPKVLGTLTFLAFMSELTGRLADARALLEAAAFLDPENVEVRDKLQKLGKTAGGR